MRIGIGIPVVPETGNGIAAVVMVGRFGYALVPGYHAGIIDHIPVHETEAFDPCLLQFADEGGIPGIGSGCPIDAGGKKALPSLPFYIPEIVAWCHTCGGGNARLTNCYSTREAATCNSYITCT